jgi:hypothetical protein
MHAERRLGELIIAQKETHGLAQGRRSDLLPKEKQAENLTQRLLVLTWGRFSETVGSGDADPAAVFMVTADHVETTSIAPDVLRERARRSRELLNVAIAPEVIEQLKVWARDFGANKLTADLAATRRALYHSMKNR